MFCKFEPIENGIVQCPVCKRSMRSEFTINKHVCPEWEKVQPVVRAVNAKCVSGMIHGIGDLIINLWFAEATRDSQVRLYIYARGERRTLVEMFNHPVLANWIGYDCIPNYEYELNHPEISRMECRRLGLEIPEQPVRPKATIADEYHEWAEAQCSQGKRLVLLFPTSAHRVREWPVSYWIDLATELRGDGYEVKTLLAEKDVRFHSMPSLYYGLDLRKVAALMLRSNLVIGNDSGMANLSGTLDVKTLVILGATASDKIYDHTPSVHTVSGDLFCKGCFYKRHYREACEQGCAALQQLPVEKVVNYARVLLIS